MHTPFSQPSTSAIAFGRTEMCLGISLAHREIGHALATGEDLLRYGVMNIRKLHSEEAKQARVRQEVGRLLDRYPCTRLAVVLPPSVHQVHPLMRSLATWLADEAQRRELVLHTYAREQVGDTPGDHRPHTDLRAVAQRLAQRFPELRSLVRDIVPTADAAGPTTCARQSRVPTAKERYWFRMFVALAAAVRALESRILNENRSAAPPRFE